jgi:hypothetical protein
VSVKPLSTSKVPLERSDADLAPPYTSSVPPELTVPPDADRY